MTIAAAIVAPHPPLLIPEIGRDNLRQVKNTADALARAAEVIRSLAPETLVIISPHSPVAASTFLMRGDSRLSGSFERFGHPEIKMELNNDVELVSEVARLAKVNRQPAAVTDESAAEGVDWGVLVPYHYLGGGRPVISLSISALDYRDHFVLGQTVVEAARRLGRRVVFIASGDLSHRLTPESPYGYSPAGPDFDDRIVDIFTSGKLSELEGLDSSLVVDAAECGLKSFVTMAGALSGHNVTPKVFSHEGPFGVGYVVASFVVEGEPLV